MERLRLAAGRKLAHHGMNVCLIHRNRISELIEIQKNFNDIISEKVKFILFNNENHASYTMAC